MVITYVIFYIVLAAAAAALATPLVMLALGIPGEISPLVLGVLCSVTTAGVGLCLIYHRASWLLLGVPAVTLTLAAILEIITGIYRNWPGTIALPVALVVAIMGIEAIAFCGVYPFRIHGRVARRATTCILAHLRRFPAGTVLACEPDILLSIGAAEHQVTRSVSTERDPETFSFAPLGATVARSADPVPDIVATMLARIALQLLGRPLDLHPVSDADLEELHRQLTHARPVEA